MALGAMAANPKLAVKIVPCGKRRNMNAGKGAAWLTMLVNL
jgi:hypothetical protein